MTYLYICFIFRILSTCGYRSWPCGGLDCAYYLKILSVYILYMYMYMYMYCVYLTLTLTLALALTLTLTLKP